jgi:hypothetical protein
MNFKNAFKVGQRGQNKGLPLGSEGLSSFSRALRGVLKSRIYAVGAAPKVGKTTLVDIGFVIGPCMYVINHNNKIQKEIDNLRVILPQSSEPVDILNRIEFLEKKLLFIEIIYFSFEIDRVTKEFDFVVHFLATEYGITTVKLPEGFTFEGKDFVSLSSSYLRGELTYDGTEEEIIRVSDSLQEKIETIYRERIIPLFGEYDEKGKRLSKGLIYFREARDNPTGLRNTLLSYAASKGEILYDTYTKENVVHKKLAGYRPSNPKLLTLVVTDHVRKLVRERGFSLKETVDKYSEYSVEFRDLFGFSFVHICHINRNIMDSSRRELDDDRIYPNSDDFKDTGNLAEDANYVITMFNPTDDKYNLAKHFGIILRRPNKSLLHPELRTIHIVDSRNTEAPQHFAVNMLGALKNFKPFINK